MSNAYFLFNNLKVDNFHLQDKPLPGFELVTWDHQSWIVGTLWDIGGDAGYTPIGTTKVYGQIWRAEQADLYRELVRLLGADKLTEPYETKAKVELNEIEKVDIDVTVFKLREINSQKYKILVDGKWLINREYRR